MRYRFRTLLIVLFMSVVPLAATTNAQPLLKQKHDWTVVVGGYRYGITEQADGIYRDTRIRLGPLDFYTTWSAFQVVVIGLTPPAIVLTAVAITLSSRKRDNT
jgi:hypothetical protein